MNTENPKIEKIREIISVLEDLRDRLLKEGQGPFMSDSLFEEIDRLYGWILEEMGMSGSEPPRKE